jgi:hypothetical protein
VGPIPAARPAGPTPAGRPTEPPPGPGPSTPDSTAGPAAPDSTAGSADPSPAGRRPAGAGVPSDRRSSASPRTRIGAFRATAAAALRRLLWRAVLALTAGSPSPALSRAAAA